MTHEMMRRGTQECAGEGDHVVRKMRWCQRVWDGCGMCRVMFIVPHLIRRRGDGPLRVCGGHHETTQGRFNKV